MRPAIHRAVRYTYAEYLAHEAGANTRHEYIAGEILAMAGGTVAHARLASRALAQLASSLPAGCEAFNSDLRIRLAEADMATYPDVVVICGPVRTAPDDPDAAINPRIIVEVTSPSTEAYDRGEKLRAYWTLPSVEQVVILSHREPQLTVHTRDGSAQVFTAGTVALAAAPATLDLDRLHAG